VSTIGHRARIIERTENRWEQTYSHWGAANLKNLPKHMFFNENAEVDMDTLRETAEELKEKGVNV
jgi:hypothetical protein